MSYSAVSVPDRPPQGRHNRRSDPPHDRTPQRRPAVRHSACSASSSACSSPATAPSRSSAVLGGADGEAGTDATGAWPGLVRGRDRTRRRQPGAARPRHPHRGVHLLRRRWRTRTSRSTSRRRLWPIENSGEGAAMYCWAMFLLIFTGSGALRPGPAARPSAPRPQGQTRRGPDARWPPEPPAPSNTTAAPSPRGEAPFRLYRTAISASSDETAHMLIRPDETRRGEQCRTERMSPREPPLTPQAYAVWLS